MNWSKIKDGYQFNIYFQNGDHSSPTIQTVVCSLNEKDFVKTKAILSHLKDAIDLYYESHTGKLAKYISDKTGIVEKDIRNIIEPVVLTDISISDWMATVNYIDVYKYENGMVEFCRL